MSTDQRVKELKHRRATFRAQITRFKGIVEPSNGEFDYVTLGKRTAKLDEYLKEFEIYRTELEILDAGVNPAENLDIGDEALVLIGRAEKILERHNSSSPSGLSANNETESANGLRSGSAVDRDCDLPKISLPTFSGAYEDWPGFADQFKTAVHENSKITDSKRLTYLRSCLRGGAARKIEHLSNEGSNYAIAWDILKKKYDDSKLIVAGRLRAIFEAPVCRRECSEDLQTFLNVAEPNYRTLKGLNQPSADTILIHLLRGKLPAVTAQRWKEHKCSSDFPRIEEFFEFLNDRCKELEPAGENSSHRPIRRDESDRVRDAKRLTKSRPPNDARVAYSTQVHPACPVCGGKHAAYQCEKLIRATPKEREIAVREAKLCRNCLGLGHNLNNCRSPFRCKRCSQKHHSMLHAEEEGSRTQANSACLQSSVRSEVLLATAIVDIVDSCGKSHECRVLLDSGAQSNFVSESLAERLQLPRHKVNISVSGINESVGRVKFLIDARLMSKFHDYAINSKFLILPRLTDNLPSRRVNRSDLAIPRNVRLADPQFDKPAAIDVILGASVCHKLFCVGRISLNNDRAALQKTHLGWIISGEIGSDTPSTSVTCNLSTCTLQDLSKFWEIPETNDNPIPSNEEKACEKHYRENTTRDPATGRYAVRLPFNEKIQDLGDSYYGAIKRYHALERSFARRPELEEKYREFMREYIDLGHMSEVPCTKRDEGYYLPHHAVVKQSSLTTKLRVVFDASAQSSSRLSLNDTLLIGPVIQDSLISLVLRFRCHAYALTADIAKMYRQILVHPEDRKFQKILWRDSKNEPIRTYVLNTVTYGTSSASFLATRSLHQLADDEHAAHPRAATIVKRDFYVDDLLTGAETLKEALHIRDELMRLMSKGGFQLRQWASNDPRLISDLQEQSNDTQICLNLEDPTKALGIVWNPRWDTITYSINLGEIQSRVTKRAILSQVAQLFDPLGLLGPVILVGKLIIQRLWQLKCDWDESIPMELYTTWIKYESQLKSITKVTHPRRITSNSAKEIQLHGFCDASERAYGAVLYTRSVEHSGKITTRLICSRSRVAPLKTLSLPRLELCAAVLLANLFDSTHRALQLQFSKIIFWSDSTIALQWLKTPPNTLKTFVANRVSEVQKLTEGREWRHVSSQDNPADHLSRGLLPAELPGNRLWQEGPAWLGSSESRWPVLALPAVEIPETRQLFTFAATTAENNILLRFSRFSKLRRVVAYCLRWRKIASHEQITKGHLSATEIKNATRRIIELVQHEAFANELQLLRLDSGASKSKNRLGPLNPFIDASGILRVGGRLSRANITYEQKHPALLPGKHHVTKLIIRHEHLRNMHAGAQATLNHIRQEYWITDGKATVRNVIRSCVTCLRAKPVHPQPPMGLLPKERVTPGRPFTTTGVDFCGPFFVKERTQRNRGRVKVYAAIFVCFCTKAVHIELVNDLSSEAFLAALKRFFARRGKSSNIYSDNGTNFVGACHEIKRLHEFINDSENNSATLDFLANEGIEWHFIPPRAPHFGGLWEAAVKSVKHHVTRVIGETLLTYEGLLTYLVEIEGILNSRPIAPLSSDPNDLSALTPGHFLIGDSMGGIREQDYSKLKDNRLSMWQHITKMKQHFWTRWHKEYLHELTIRKKWHKVKENDVCVGQMVLLKEDNTSPMRWKLGRIVTTHPGEDGIIRVVTVKTATGCYKRSVQGLSLLPTKPL